MTDETSPESVSPESPALTASSELSRPARADEFRSQRRSQVSTVLPALLLIGIGLLYLFVNLAPSERIIAAIGAIGIGFILRFLMNGRREPGLFFIGLLILFWLGISLANPLLNVEFSQAWPLLICATGIALILMVGFQRSRELKLLLPGFLIAVSGAALLPFTLGLFVDQVMTTIAIFWPLLLVVPILILLPRLIRRES